MNGENPEERSAWPPCKSEQVQVMLLGTYHMDNPRLDRVNITADDVLTADRQNQLRDLVEHLADWEPDRVVVNRSYNEFNDINNLYTKYKSEKYSYNQEEILEPSQRSDGNLRCRNEIIQVGFRLAEFSDLDYIYPIDERPQEPETDPFRSRNIDSSRKVPITLPDVRAMTKEGDERLWSSTIPEYFAWLNSEDKLRDNHNLMFDMGIRAADDQGQFGSPIVLSFWYDRHIRMVHHLWRATEPTDDRILVIIGAGHVRVLRHLLDEAPMYCPVSPLPYLR